MKNFTLESAKIENPENVISAFKNAGFAEITYKNQDGVFLSKDYSVDDIDCVYDILGNFLDNDSVRVELISDGSLQICVNKSINFERFTPDNPYWKILANSAGVVIE